MIYKIWQKKSTKKAAATRLWGYLWSCFSREELSKIRIVERCEKRFTVQQLQTLEEMLNIINNELMPEINLDDRKKRQRNLNVMSELEN